MALTPVGEISNEFVGAELPDWRLRERLMSLARDMDQSPDVSLPAAVGTTAAREGAYRFLGNARVSLEGILAPHIRATARRCEEAGVVYVVSDTTEFSYQGEGRGEKLGRLHGNSKGFLGHFALAVSGGGEPLGVLGIETIVRQAEKKKHRNTHQQKKDPDRESLRWAAMVEQTSGIVGDNAAIHVMDSEADIFELLTEMHRKGRRFIVRSCQDRVLETGHLAEAVEQAPVRLSREVRLSRRRKTKNNAKLSRRNPPREGREATLLVSSVRVSLRRPKTCTVEYPAFLPVNVVHVREKGAPEGEEPVEWILLTSEPVESDMNVAAVIDGYRHRWIIEEYFKALKTGCAYESRQLESMRTLTNLLGIVAPIAWRLLALRSLHRANSTQSASEILDADLLEALAARLKDIGEKKPMPMAPTVADLMKAIARLGGHITSNGPPGWQVLWRGYQDLLTWGGGYIRGKSTTYSDLS